MFAVDAKNTTEIICF